MISALLVASLAFTCGAIKAPAKIRIENECKSYMYRSYEEDVYTLCENHAESTKTKLVYINKKKETGSQLKKFDPSPYTWRFYVLIDPKTNEINGFQSKVTDVSEPVGGNYWHVSVHKKQYTLSYPNIERLKLGKKSKSLTFNAEPTEHNALNYNSAMPLPKFPKVVIPDPRLPVNVTGTFEGQAPVKNRRRSKSVSSRRVPTRKYEEPSPNMRSFMKGDRVRISGLTSKREQKYNGKVGILQSKSETKDPKDGYKWTIRINGTNRSASIRGRFLALHLCRDRTSSF